MPSLQKPLDGGYAACQMAGLAGHMGNVGQDSSLLNLRRMDRKNAKGIRAIVRELGVSNARYLLDNRRWSFV
jgi:hypothetical protein